MILIKMKETGLVPGVAKRELQQIKRAAYAAIGEFWHRAYRAKHFTHAGAKEYGYTPRKGEGAPAGSKFFRGSYTGRKLRKLGHTYPLVYSGLSKKLTEMRDVRATFRGCRVVLHAPALNFRNPHSNVFMADEMRRISVAEKEVLVRLFDRKIERGIKAAKTRSAKSV